MGLSLNQTLVEMLGEHFSHRTERRGCGYTQATRHLAVLVNRPRDRHRDTVAQLFPVWARDRGYASDPDLLGQGPRPAEALADQTFLRTTLRSLPTRLEREESRLLADIIADLADPTPPDGQELLGYPDNLPVGTCPLAERFFLEIADRFVRRKGRVNVIISDRDEPLMIEKLHLGDDHSCISVTELRLNGVRLPPASLLAVHYDGAIGLRPNHSLPGEVIPASSCTGFRFLRLTTLAVSPANRRRAFSTHFESQVQAGLYAPGETTVDQLRRVALEQL
jgi:hypothetical protein